MRLFRPAAIVFVIASVLALAALVFAASLSAQERTPQWLFEHGHIGEARAVAQGRVSANPIDAAALAWLARTHTASGDIKGAIALAEKAVAANARLPLSHLALAEALGEEVENANVFRRLPLARRIKKTLETALSLNPNDVETLDGLMQFYLLAPGIAGGSGEKADQMAARILAIDPARGYIAQARIASRRKQTARVEELFVKAFEANRSSVHARMALANFYAGRLDKQADAEAHAKALLAIDPALLTPYRVLAVVYARGRRWAELDAILEQSDRQHPSNLLAAFAAAQILRDAKTDLPRAERYFRRYLSQPPEIGMPTHAMAQRELQLVLANKRSVP